MAFLYEIDKFVFLFLNQKLANPVLDLVMPFVTEVDNWRIPILLIWLSLIIFGKKKGRITALMVVIILTLSDQISSSVVKPLISRTRPCFVLEGVHLLIKQPRSPSFPSSHAANMAAMATLFSIQYRKSMWFAVPFAALIGYSRIYVGVHYPSDVLGGAVLGVLCALLIIGIERRITTLWQAKKSKQVDLNGTSEA